jgi:hypothetical protein
VILSLAVASPALAQELLPAEPAASAIRFVEPCRLVDTRSAPPAVPFGGPALAVGVARSFALGGKCSVPADAPAVQLYVTVTDTAGRGHLRIGPSGAPMPPTPSMNFDAAGRTLGVPVATALGAGSFDVTAIASGTHLIVDVVGYYSNTLVTALNGESGPVEIVGGTNVSVSTAGGTITLDAPLTVGPEGPMGPQGPAGPEGAIGPQGPQGDTGAQGPEGPQGTVGPKGDEGAQGPQGATGPKGDTGAQGPQGAQGLQGPQGPAGPQGVQGLTGPQGPEGPAGPAGAGAIVKDKNGVTLGLLLTQDGYGPTVLTSTGYQVRVPWNGNLASLANTQMYFNNAGCTLNAGERAWVNTGNKFEVPTLGRQAYWAGTVGSYLVPITVDANGVSLATASEGVMAILNATSGCSTSSSTNWGWEVRKATLAELGLPATIAAPLQMPTP